MWSGCWRRTSRLRRGTLGRSPGKPAATPVHCLVAVALPDGRAPSAGEIQAHCKFLSVSMGDNVRRVSQIRSLFAFREDGRSTACGANQETGAKFLKEQSGQPDYADDQAMQSQPDANATQYYSRQRIGFLVGNSAAIAASLVPPDQPYGQGPRGVNQRRTSRRTSARRKAHCDWVWASK